MPIARSGALAVELLLQSMGSTTPDEIAVLPSELIVRGSTAPPRT